MARRDGTSTELSVAGSTDPAAPRARLWEDFIDIFYAPSDVFARRRDGKFGYALLFLTLAGVTLHVMTKNAIQPVLDAEFAFRSAEMVRANPQLTSEQLAAGRGVFETFAPVIFAVSFPVAVILTGIVLWVVSKAFDAKEPLVAAIMISTYSQVPRLLQFITTAAQGLLMPPESITSAHSVSLSVARFMDQTTALPVLLALAARVDVFTIWITVLLAIGLHVVARIPKRSAAIAAAITWLAGALPTVIGALRAG